MAAAWNSFFKAFPGYRNVFVRHRVDGAVVAIEGHSVCSDPRLEGQLCGGRSCGRERSHNGAFTRTLSKTGECLGCSHLNDSQIL